MEDSNPPALEAFSVSRRYTRRDGSVIEALTDVSLKVRGGEFVCIVGPSGCGKSTLLQICAGLDYPSDGELRASGRQVTGPGPDRGVVFQRDSVFPWMTVIDNVEYGLKCRNVPAEQRQRLARLYLGRVGLTEVAYAWPRELSGGMLKRVAIASVFANGSPVLLLDEPFGALDYVTRHKIHDVLLDLWDDPVQQGRRTVLFVTHDVDEALVLGDRIMVMHSGRIIDDFRVPAGRPRSEESLLETMMIELKRRLLHHLGIGQVLAPPSGEEAAR
jgi:NitT/TauT family transport system ATP-binding protein